MNIINTPLLGVKLLEPVVWQDVRGHFMEMFRDDWFRAHVADVGFVQENQSFSHKNVLRGLHYQLPPHAQGKLIRVISGEVFDVVVDLRQSSPTFGQWFGAKLSAENGRQMWIPSGLAHGFYVLKNNTVCVYRCTDYYCPSAQRTIIWNDGTIGIKWGNSLPPVLSEQDACAPPFLFTELFD